MTSLHSTEFSPLLGLPFSIAHDDLIAAKSSIQYFRFIQQSMRLIQRTYASLLKTEQLDKAQQRLQHLHQAILDLTAHLDGVESQWYQDLMKWMDTIMREAHTHFYIQHYLLSLEQAAESKCPLVVQQYVQRGLDILMTGLDDLYANHALLQQYLQLHGWKTASGL
ncbi:MULTISPECIES: hypothetical protein [unclassified Acinetobacter]|uniref:hypothetical protein n=1 Tax=unclassified Acinetobacter TaxID=196816 RepID=UPI00235FAFBA|nr:MULTISPECIES: hypothetical protein [unclassified Acinetobacter]